MPDTEAWIGGAGDERQCSQDVAFKQAPHKYWLPESCLPLPRCYYTFKNALTSQFGNQIEYSSGGDGGFF